MRPRRTALGMLVAAALAVAPAEASAVTYRSCKPVINPYPGTRYEGVDLSRIRAAGISCAKARRVARGAHRKALASTPPADGVRELRWNGWKVTGRLHSAQDRYLAVRGDARVRWMF